MQSNELLEDLDGVPISQEYFGLLFDGDQVSMIAMKRKQKKPNK